MFVNKVKVFTIVGIFSFLFVANAEWVFENNTVTDGNWILSAKIDDTSNNLTLTRYSEGEGILDLSTICEDTSTSGLIIGNSCFYVGSDDSFTALTGLVLPDSLVEIQQRAFRGCIGLTGHISCDAEFTISANDAFAYTAITSVNFPNIIGTIPVWTFYNCTSLTSVVISDKVTNFGDNSFGKCSSLATLEPREFPLITSLGTPFSNCSSLKGVISFPNLLSAGGSAFHSTKFTEILLPKCNSVGGSCFYGTSATNIVLAPVVTNVGTYAFAAAYSLKTLQVKEFHLDTFPSGCFNSSKNIEGILDFSKSTFTSVTDSPFQEKQNLDRVIFPKTVQSFGNTSIEKVVDTEFVFLGPVPTFPNELFYPVGNARSNVIVLEENLSSWTNANSGVTFTPLAAVPDSEKTDDYYFPDTDYARTIGTIAICGRDQWFSLLNKIGTILILR